MKQRGTSAAAVFCFLVAMGISVRMSHAQSGYGNTTRVARGYSRPALFGYIQDSDFLGPLNIGYLFYARTRQDFKGGFQAIVAGANMVDVNFNGIGEMTTFGVNLVREDFNGGIQFLLVGGNEVNGRFRGVGQFVLAGANVVDRDFKGGIQFVGPGVNKVHGCFSGAVQFGIANYAGEVRGVQIGIVNYARELHGLQVGIANIAGGNALPFAPVINVGF